MKPALFLFLISGLVLAQKSPVDLLERKTLAEVRRLDDSLKGVLGFAAIDLNTGRVLSYNADTVFPQASSIKIPILIQVFRSEHEGKLKFTDTLRTEPAEGVGGSGKIQETLKKGPVNLTVRELVTAMIQDSDNTATNKLIALVGMEAVNRTLDEFGFSATRLQRKMMDSDAAARNAENISTPMEMARLMETIYSGRIVDESASRGLIGFLKLVKDDMRAAVPAGVEVASKPGDLDGVRCETGLILLPGRPFVLSVESTFLQGDENPVRRVTEIVFRHFDLLARSNQYGHRLQ